MPTTTEEFDSHTATFTKKRKQPSSLQFEHYDSESGDKRLKLETLRSKHNTFEPGEISDATSFSRRPSKDSATSDEVHQVGKLHPSGWNSINSHSAITHDLPFQCDQCPKSFRHNHDLKKHTRIHVMKVNDDPFITFHQQGYAPGADGGSADGMISTNPSHYGYDSMAPLAGLDRTTYARDTKMQETILKKMERAESLSNEEYVIIARWLAHNDTALQLSEITNSRLTESLRTESFENNPVDQMSIAGALESLSCRPNPYGAARKFLKDRYWSVTQYVPMAQWLESNDDQFSLHDIQSVDFKAKVKSMLESHNVDERGGVAKVLGMISRGGSFRISAHVFIKQRYEALNTSGDHGGGVVLHGYMESENSILGEAQNREEISATAYTSNDENPSYNPKMLQSVGPLSKKQYAEIARWLEHNDDRLEVNDIQHRGLMKHISSMLTSHDFRGRSGVAKALGKTSRGGVYHAIARTSLRQRYEAVNPSETTVRDPNYGIPLNGDADNEDTPSHNYQYMVQWLETHLDGPKVNDMQDSDLEDRVRKMMKSKHMEEDANIAVILFRISQLKNKRFREGAQTWLKEYYESARRATPDTKVVERDPLSKEGWVERALAVGKTNQNDVVGIIRLDDVGWKSKIQQEVAKQASRCTRKSVEEILREAIVRKWRVHKQATRRLRSGYQSQKVTDGPRLDILQASLPSWSLEEVEKVIQNQTSFLRPLVASDVIQRAAHSALPAHVVNDVQSLSGYSFAHCLLEMAKRYPDDGFSKQCLAEFVTINYVGGKSNTSIHSRDGVEELMRLKAVSQPSFQPISQGERQCPDVHSNHCGSPPSPLPSTLPEPFNYGELARDRAVRNASYPDAARDSEMGGLQAHSADHEYLQQRYFHTSDPTSFRCLCCGGEGHVEDLCPSLTCNHCGAVDDHFSGACPASQKCGCCRQRGHLTTNCTINSSSLMTGLNDECVICGRPDHVEEECSALWRSLIRDEGIVNLVPEQAMRVSCYNCGATDRFGFWSSHWGDDCPKINRCDRNVQGLNDTFSAKHADKFVQKKVELQPRSAGHGSIPRYQLAMLDD